MTYRDDHEATLARAAALEHELAAAKEQADEQADALAASERERARLAAELREHRHADPQPAFQVDADRDAGHSHTPHLPFIVIVAGLILLGITCGVLFSLR